MAEVRLTCETCGASAAATDAQATGWRYVGTVAGHEAGEDVRVELHLRCSLCTVGALAVALRVGPDHSDDAYAAEALAHYRTALQRKEHDD